MTTPGLQTDPSFVGMTTPGLQTDPSFVGMTYCGVKKQKAARHAIVKFYNECRAAFFFFVSILASSRRRRDLPLFALLFLFPPASRHPDEGGICWLILQVLLAHAFA
jgi:hypothetical protein